ncbi:MAG: hypothetical protein ABIQ44_07975, partial [Chloroflexia bacterium]
FQTYNATPATTKIKTPPSIRKIFRRLKNGFFTGALTAGTTACDAVGTVADPPAFLPFGETRATLEPGLPVLPLLPPPLFCPDLPPVPAMPDPPKNNKS